MSLKSPLVPLAVIVLSFGQLFLAGRNATKIVVENLKNPLASSNLRLVDLVQWSPATARVHELTFTRPQTGPTYIGDGARLRVQLWSKGRTRILIIRPAGSDWSRRQALLDLFRGRGRLQIVADRKWVDLGPLPTGDTPLAVQVTGLLPGPYGFAELVKPADPVFEDVRMGPPDKEPAAARAFPRYRVTVAAPVDAKETLARFFFFISVSRVLQIAGVLALALLFAGWWLLGEDRTTTAICCLIPSVVLLHAVCLPPLQGADETSHGATIEALLFRGMPVRDYDPYPGSWSHAASWLEQDRVQYQPDEPLPLRSPEERTRLATRLVQALIAEASEKGSVAPQSGVQGVDSRSALFYRLFEPLGPVLRPLSIVDRISAYRLLSALSGLVLFCAGALLLHRADLDSSVVVAYGLVWVIPYMVFTVASISNYALAIGLGSVLAACAVVLILSERRSEKAVAGVSLVAGSWLGIPIWPDFIFLAPVTTLAITLGGLDIATRRLRPSTRRTLLAASTALLLGVATLFARAVFRTKAGNIGTRMPAEFPKSLDRSAVWMILAVLAPLLLASVSALALYVLAKIPEQRTRRILAGTSALLALLLVMGFLFTPWTFIPYENYRYSFLELVREHLKVFLSNSLAWDQDVLSWKFYMGVAGWHDTPYPDWTYAVSRWALVLFLIWIPLRLAHSTVFPLVKTRALVLIAGLGASLSVITLTIRYLGPGNPWGRFILPWLPLVLTPLLIPLASRPENGSTASAVRVGVLVQAWTVVFILGTRFLFGLR